MKEIKSLRRAREKHFLNKDGTITAYLYDNDIHYLKNGVYEEIDNTIINNKDKLINKKNVFKTAFLKDVTKEYLVDIQDNKNNYLKLNLKDKNNNTKLEYQNNEVTYNNILDNIDFNYQVLSTKLKESIILKNKNNIPNYFDFIIDTNLDLSLNNNKIEAKKDNKNIFIIDIPYMVDNNNNYNYNINYELLNNNSSYTLRLNLDKDWLDKASYPVVIDPTIVNPQSNSYSVYDTYIVSKLPDANMNDEEIDSLSVSVSEDNISRSLLKFELPTIGTGCEIVNASIYVKDRNRQINDENYVAVHAINANWDENTATWNNMANNYDSKIEDYTILDHNGLELGTINSFNITNLVKRWYAGKSNYGVILKQYDETYSGIAKSASFYSKTYDMNHGTANRPYLAVTYRNLNGLENYMSYKTFNYSNGASYVNNLTGNLTTTFNLNETIGGKFPASLNLIYNTNDVVLNKDYGCGLGWKFNLQETITKITIDGANYLEYIDGDGTIHYFMHDYNDNGEIDNSSWVDEDGLGLKASLNENSLTLTDKNNNKYIFTKKEDTYYLTKIEDTKGASLNIVYTNNKITKIIDGNNDEISLTYNANSIVVSSSNRNTTISLINNLVTKISSKYGDVNIDYNADKLIAKIDDLNGLKTSFNYYDVSPYKISKVSELGTDDIVKNYYKFYYGFLTSKVVEKSGKFVVYTFNEQGNVVSVNNYQENNADVATFGIGRKMEGKFGFASSLTSFINKAINKKITDIPALRYTKNLIKNSSLEEGNNTLFSVPSNRSMDYARTGKYSQKILNNDYLSLNNLKLNQEYTLSFYAKNNNNVTLKIMNSNDMINSTNLPINNDFKRYSITFIANNTNLKAVFNSLDAVYIDDLQLEIGSFANYYNLIENGDFSDGLNGWEYEINASDGDGIITLLNGDKALRVYPKLGVDKSLGKTFEISGCAPANKDGIGDVYYLSFMYKSTSVNKDGVMAGNIGAIINFWPDEDENIPEESRKCTAKCSIPVSILSSNDEWQFMSVPFFSEPECPYKKVSLYLFLGNNVNEFNITNISLTKDIEQNYNLNNPNTGNLDTILNTNRTTSEFKYDKNNQLTSMFNPKGNNFTFEYDNNVADRVLKGVSPTGISNEIKYDSNGNPIKTLINNVNPDNEIISDKNYHIRLKGTNKYLDCDFINRNIKIKEDDCSHDAFTIHKEGSSYYFKISNLYINANTEVIITTLDNGFITFKLEKQDNGSYKIKSVLKNKYLCNKNNTLSLSDDTTKEEDMQFYFEDIDTPLFIESQAEYTSDGKFVTKTIDTLGKVTNYDINEINGLTNSITDANDIVTSYTYNNKDQITKVTKNEKEVNYEYNTNNLLSKITSGNKDYTFSYDTLLNPISVKINNQELVANNIDYRGLLLDSTYGNGSKTTFNYDSLDRLTTKITDNKTYNYFYDNLDNLRKIIDGENIYNYEYDISKRLSKYSVQNNNNYFDVEYDYDVNNNITKNNYKLDNREETTIYEYNGDDAVTKVTFDNHNLNYVYDYLGRLVSKNIDNQENVSCSYVSLGNKTSSTLKTMKIGNDLYEYKYDNLYNITDIYLNNELIHHYTYDNFNQLLTDIDYTANKRYAYNYDMEGNIRTKTTFDLTSSAILKMDAFLYQNNTWEDLLTKYNNEAITYDAIGNPLTIGTKTLTWINGRQLNTLNDTNLSVAYEYNKDGIRNKKTVNNEVITYFTEGNKIIFENKDNNVIYYIRDEEGSLIGFKYNNEIYYYIKNMQEDIIGITNNNHELLCRYEYDAWGKIIAIKDNNNQEITDISHIGLINPFRYRSYYYDNETKLYYLNSRYYNPEWGRFINADGIIKAENNNYNLYTYCKNNPIKYLDILGKDAAAIGLGFWGILSGIGQVVAGITSAVLPVIGVTALGIGIGTVAYEITQIDWTNGKTNNNSNNQSGNYIVYALSKGNNVKYIGITNNEQRRRNEHRRNPAKSDLEFHKIHEGLSKPAARAAEEHYILVCNTISKGDYGRNQIHSISPKNKQYDMITRQAWAIMSEETYVGNCVWDLN